MIPDSSSRDKVVGQQLRLSHGIQRLFENLRRYNAPTNCQSLVTMYDVCPHYTCKEKKFVERELKMREKIEYARLTTHQGLVPCGWSNTDVCIRAYCLSRHIDTCTFIQQKYNLGWGPWNLEFVPLLCILSKNILQMSNVIKPKILWVLQYSIFIRTLFPSLGS